VGTSKAAERALCCTSPARPRGGQGQASSRVFKLLYVTLLSLFGQAKSVPILMTKQLEDMYWL